jgi:hypothetical protein
VPVVRIATRGLPNYNFDGAQYIDNVLTLPTAPDTTTVALSREIYNTGTYVLFDYRASSAPTPVVGSVTQIVLDTSDLIVASGGTVSNDTANKLIIVTLVGSPDNGTQFVDGVLDISAPTTIYLSADLYNTAGTYTLFDFTGGSFVGSITNITIVPPGGRAINTGVSPNGCALVGNTITVSLI